MVILTHAVPAYRPEGGPGTYAVKPVITMTLLARHGLTYKEAGAIAPYAQALRHLHAIGAPLPAARINSTP